MPVLNYLASPCAPSDILYSGAPLATVTLTMDRIQWDDVDPTFTIPSGSRAFSIYVEGAEADIQGITRPAGWSLNMDTSSFGNVDLRYPAIEIDNLQTNAVVHLVYVT